MPHQAFENFLAKTVNLSAAQISQGSKSHTHVRELLDNKWQNDSDFPWLVDGDFLSGSYARGTKIHPLDDIDIMIVLDGTGLFAISNGVQLNARVRGSGASGSPVMQHTDERGYISSAKILEVFREALKETYPNSEIKKDGQAVNVWLDSYQLGLDIVPCFHIQPNDGSQDFYYIPFGRGSTMWMTTNPKIDERISDFLDQKHDKKLKPVIKLLKYWNKEQNGGRLRSYHVEAVAWYVFNAHPEKIRDYPSALKYFFTNAGGYLAAPCADPTKLGGHIDTYLTQEARAQTIQKIQEAQRIGGNATLLGLATPEKQLAGWRRLFGNQLGT